MGLVASACFADFGYRVTCIDKDTGRIAALNDGELPIYVTSRSGAKASLAD